MQVIPAIDVLDGKVVRLAQGDFARVTVFGDDPLQIAAAYCRAGATRLHLVNLSAARHGKVDESFLALVKAISDKIEVQVGGGIRDLPAVQRHLDAGAKAVVIGTMLFTAADAGAGGRRSLRRGGRHCGPRRAGPRSENPRLAKRQRTQPCRGPAVRRRTRHSASPHDRHRPRRHGGGAQLALYAEWKRRFPQMKITASGGVRNELDIFALESAGCDAVVVGKALLDGSMTLESVRPYARRKAKPRR